MGLVQKGIKFITQPAVRMSYLSSKGYYHNMPDEEYLRRMFRLKVGYDLNLEDPKTFNEKLQWLKIHDRRPEYTTMVDKYAVKKWVADRIGEQYVIPLLGVWDHFDDIDFDALPDQFVLKCTHDSGGLVIVKDKSSMDKKSAKKKLERCLKRNYYWVGREWPYKNVKPRIIAEKYMEDESSTELKDYKVFNFDGEPKLIQVDYNRFAEHKRNLYTLDWEYIRAAIQYPTDPTHKIDRPKCLEQMLQLARTLSTGIPHVRTDFYCIDDKVYFGELTFHHGSGCEKFAPESLGEKMGDWIKLPTGGYLVISENVILYLREEQDVELKDYKLFCFHGVPKYCQVICDRNTRETIDFYDMNWEHQSFTGLALPHHPYPFSDHKIQTPSKFESMRSAAAILSAGIPFLRVDFYEVNGRMYFGELTFYPASGFGVFEPEEWNERLGDWIELPDYCRKIYDRRIGC